MKFGIFSLGTWIRVLIALLLWSGFGILLWQLGDIRTRVAIRDADRVLEDDRDRVTAQLQTLMRDTRDERAALEKIVSADALAAAATIEAAGKRAGVSVSIGGAVLSAHEGAQSEAVRAVTIVANTEGEFSSLMRAASLLETLPFPSRIESYELSSLDSTKKQKDPWRMTARIRILIPSESAL